MLLRYQRAHSHCGQTLPFPLFLPTQHKTQPPTMTASTAVQITKLQVTSTYRTITRLIKLLPANQQPEKQLDEIRQAFRKNASLTDQDEIQTRMNKAGEKIAFLRIVTPKKKPNVEDKSGQVSSKRWIYTKDGPVEIDADGKGTMRDSNGRVVSNFGGKNMDPCHVKTHNGQLKRMGFANNLHAKGLF